MKFKKLVLIQTGDGKLGIENLKLILAFIFSIVDKVMLLLSSIGGQFNVFAAMGIVQEIVANLSILAKWKEALLEIRDLDVAESQELSLYFKVNFDIENDELEQRIEEGVAFIPEAYAVLRQSISLGSRMVDWYNGWGDAKVIPLPSLEELPKTIQIAA